MATNRLEQKTAEKLDKLLGMLAANKNVAIIMQDHPDPDAVASGAALRKLANSKDVNCSLVFSGMMGRSENRALIDYLGLNLRRIAEVNLDTFDLIAMVDTQPGTGNNPLPEEKKPDIVIDHHPIHKITRSVAFTDIRSGYGATATILCEYLKEAKLDLDAPLATALLYGIRSDTQDLGRQAKKADFDAHYFLYSKANLRMLAQIQHSKLADEEYQFLDTTLVKAQVFSPCIFTRLGAVENPYMTGEIADLLVRREHTEWCLCSAIVKDNVLLSLRSKNEKKDAGSVIKRIVGRSGTAGGHHMLAGGQVPLEKGTKKEAREK